MAACEFEWHGHGQHGEYTVHGMPLLDGTAAMLHPKCRFGTTGNTEGRTILAEAIA
jgi:hypothetical protein